MENNLIRRLNRKLGNLQSYVVVNCKCGDRYLYQRVKEAFELYDKLQAEHVCPDKLLSITDLKEYLITHPEVGSAFLKSGSIYF